MIPSHLSFNLRRLRWNLALIPLKLQLLLRLWLHLAHLLLPALQKDAPSNLSTHLLQVRAGTAAILERIDMLHENQQAGVQLGPKSHENLQSLIKLGLL